MKYEITTSIYEIEDIEKLNKVNVGCVILGTPFYSVRSTNHLSNEELKQAIEKCHKLKMKAYVLMNRFFVEKELERLEEQMAYLKELKPDGIYFTDLSVYTIAKSLGMESLLIYNPDTIMTNSNDIKAYLNLGIKMVNVSKEITLDEMVRIGESVKGNLEVFVHGRLNMMHSKRHLLTNYMEFLGKDLDLRDKDDLYLMEENRDEHMPIIEDEHGTHVFTGFTLCSFEEILDLYNAGITNYRIETLFKSIDEICEIVSDYHKVLNKEVKGKDMFEKYRLSFKEENITKGFMYKKTGLLK